jgi:hypothetical protein
VSTITFPVARIAFAAFAASVALFLLHLFLVPLPGTTETSLGFQDSRVTFESSRKNYASAKVAAAGFPFGDSQKYEPPSRR